jgi:hypothetical protein
MLLLFHLKERDTLQLEVGGAAAFTVINPLAKVVD